MADRTGAPDTWLDPVRFGNVCFDTMIIRHLVPAGGGDLLKAAFAGRMVWPEAVAAELRLQSVHVPGLRAFLASCGATVLDLTTDEDLQVEDIRLEMFTRKSLAVEPTKNLGEAQCVLVCLRTEPCTLVCHDGKARDWARSHKISPCTVIDVLLLFVRLGLCKPARAWAIYVQAVQATAMYELAGYPIPGSRDRFMRDASALAALAQEDRRRETV
jgi:predicted nucleic acid-binding protein